MNAKLDTDTAAFLETLLWLNEDTDDQNRDDDLRKTGDPTIYKFSPDFVAGVGAFISGFREYLESQGFDADRLDMLQRSFGGSVFLSLSGHGCGFWDYYGDPEKTLGRELQTHLEAYSGNKYRFESLENILSWTDAGQIDVAYQPEFIPGKLSYLFSVKK